MRNNTLLAFFYCFYDQKLHKSESSTCIFHQPQKKQEKQVQNKGQAAFQSLLSVFTDTQAGKKQALWGRKEENHIQPFFLFIILLKSVQKGPQDSNGSNLKGLRHMGQHRETKPLENKQPWLPAVLESKFPVSWELDPVHPTEIQQEETLKFFCPLGPLCLYTNKLHEDAQSPTDINPNSKCYKFPLYNFRFHLLGYLVKTVKDRWSIA